MNNNLYKAKKLYEYWYHSINMMPDDIKKEFYSYDVPNEIIESWNKEFVEKTYSELESYLDSKPNVNEYDDRYFAKVNIILKYFDKDKKNLERIISILDKFHKNNFLVIELKKNSLKYDYLFKCSIICDKNKLSKENLEEICFFSGDKYCGLLELLYRNKYIDLYNKLISILCDAIKEAGIYFQLLIKDIIGYLEFINDEDNLNSIKKSILFNKSKYMKVKSDYSPDVYIWEI